MKTSSFLSKLLIYLAKGIEVIWRLFYFCGGMVILLLVGYFLGNDLLFGLRGGDTANNVSVIYWFDHWFPRIPLWYPLQNGGISLLYGYQFFAQLLTVYFHRISHISIAGSYQLFSFSSVILVSLGIYFFVWSRLKNQTTAFLSAFLYFLSPISWVWLYTWGFYGESISYVFIVPAMLFFDVFLCGVIARKANWLVRIAFLLGVVSLLFVWITHALAFLGVVFFFPFYGILYPFISAKKQRIRQGLLGGMAAFFFLAATYLLGQFHEINFQYYSMQSKNAGSVSKEFFFQDASDWKILPFLNLGTYPQSNRHWAERDLSFSVVVWVMAVLGVLVSFWFSKKLFVIGLFSACNFLFVFYPAPIWWVLNLTGTNYYRPLIIPLRIFLPILAAYGIAFLPQLFWTLVFFWRRFLSGVFLLLSTYLRSMLIAVSTLVLAVMLLLLFRYYSPNGVRYGPDVVHLEMFADESFPYLCPQKDNLFVPHWCHVSAKPAVSADMLRVLCSSSRFSSKPSVCLQYPPPTAVADLTRACSENTIPKEQAQFCTAVGQPFYRLFDIHRWPQLALPGGDATMLIHPLYQDFVKAKKKYGDGVVRVDVSPNLGELTQTFNMTNYSDSMLNLWGYQATLSRSYWGYQQQVFYAKNQNSTAIYNIAQWYGTQYVLENAAADPVGNFDQDPQNWEKASEGIYRFRKPVGLYSYSTNKPTVLVIGSQKHTAYEGVFRLATAGVLSYDAAVLAMGKEYIDDYSLAQLKQFSGLVLYGYSYHNRAVAFNLLDKYISEGGKVFLFTGWQYVDKDWQLASAPEFFPVTSLTWSNSVGTSAYTLEDSSYGSVSVDKFQPLRWGSEGWGVSVAEGVRPWAKTILSVSGNPLVVGGNYGKGKIVWSGVNWIGHISTYQNNADEMHFLSALFKKLFVPAASSDEVAATHSVSMDRDYPDSIVFTFTDNFSPGNFYLRESYHPDWKAWLLTKNGKIAVSIVPAGPQYKLVLLPSVSAGDQLVFGYDNGIRGIVGIIISIIGLLGILAYIIFGRKLLVLFVTPIHSFWHKGRRLVVNPITKLHSSSNEDEDY
jgi:hypothetical protein